MLLFYLVPIVVICLAVFFYRLPKIRRRATLERRGVPYCPACLRDLSDLDLRATEFCPNCRRRLPRFSERTRSV